MLPARASAFYYTPNGALRRTFDLSKVAARGEYFPPYVRPPGENSSSEGKHPGAVSVAWGAFIAPSLALSKIPFRCHNQSNVNGKAKGTRAEHKSIRLVQAPGYACTRAAASLGAWDIISVGSTDFALLQVKTRDWPGLVETEKLRLFPAPPNCRKLVHRWVDRQRQREIKEL